MSFEKPSSTAPARVPVARNVVLVLGDQANVAVLGISRTPTIVENEGSPWVAVYSRKNSGWQL